MAALLGISVFAGGYVLLRPTASGAAPGAAPPERVRAPAGLVFFQEPEPAEGAPAAPEAPDDPAEAPADDTLLAGPGPVEPDLFHPAHEPDARGVRPELPAPRRGGRVIVHMELMPRHFNHMTENTAWVEWILREVHEWLLQPDWETWEFESRIAREWIREDRLVLRDSDEDVYGEVTRADDGWLVTPRSPKNPLAGPTTLPASVVREIVRGSVFTFVLRDDVRWHDGRAFDANDVLFSWRCYFNPTIDCEDNRDKIQKLSRAVVVDDHTIRFFADEQYALLLQAFGSLTLLPAHLYDLNDPENPDFRAPRAPGGALDPLGDVQGRYVNDNPHNLRFVGLGPYRLVEVNDQYLEAKRVDGYFDPERAGWVDAIRWRHVKDDGAARMGVLQGEFDYWRRMTSDDYFGEFSEQPEFTERYYKAYAYLPVMQYLAWNMRRPQFEDRRVRVGLAHAFDWDEYLRTKANGLGVRVTSTWFVRSPGYDHSITPIPFDLDMAAELFDDAGWYDRDGDDVRDKDGVPFEFTFLTTPGNTMARDIAVKLQENLARVQVRMNVDTRDWATFQEQTRRKDFDTFAKAWVLDIENDPYQLWHSWEGDPAEDRSANYPGLEDEQIDELIHAFQVEVDDAARREIGYRLQQRIYELQPYTFAYTVPTKFAVAKRVRNFKSYGLNPGYSVRDWYVVED